MKIIVINAAIVITVILQMTSITSCTKEGPAGKDGIDGINGTNGIDGKNGTAILNGEGTPQASIGKEGDYYIDLQNALLYGPKNANSWAPSSIKLRGNDGSNGLNGATILSGISNPSNLTGKIGDLYLNTTTYVLYGPKSGTGWGAGLLLKSGNDNSGSHTFIFSNPWAFVNGFGGTNMFSFSLFPNVSLDVLKTGSIDVYLETKRSDTLTGQYMEPAGWTKVGSVAASGGTGLARGAFMESSFTAWTIYSEVGAVIVEIGFGTNNLKISTLNQAKYWSCIKAIKVVISPSSSVTYMKKPHVNVIHSLSEE